MKAVLGALAAGAAAIVLGVVVLAGGAGGQYAPSSAAAPRGAIQPTCPSVGPPGGCGQGSGPLAGSAATYGLPAGYAVPPGTPPRHAAAVSFALAQLGKPYVWGAAGPGSYDCSGLTLAAWAAAGVTLEHYTGDQQVEGSAVSPEDLIPGDLVLVPGSDPPAPGVAGHVGIYLGYGLVESAEDPAVGVTVQTWSVFVGGGLDALRDPAPGE